MSLLRIERVLALPGTLAASTMYIVKSAEAPFAEVYFTNADGSEARHVINKSEINSMISDAVSTFASIEVVADITARDAMTPTANALVLTLDASDDATVTSGAALYVYQLSNTTWHKVSEFESLDVVLEWSAIQNKPTSSVADIDSAVAQRHTHANATTLDKLGENADGLTFDGDNIEAYIANAAW